MPRITSKQSTSVKISIEGQSDSDEELDEKRTRERRGKVKRQEKPSEIEVCSCPTCMRLFMRTRNEQVRIESKRHALPATLINHMQFRHMKKRRKMKTMTLRQSLMAQMTTNEQPKP